MEAVGNWRRRFLQTPVSQRAVKMWETCFWVFHIFIARAASTGHFLLFAIVEVDHFLGSGSVALFSGVTPARFKPDSSSYKSFFFGSTSSSVLADLSSPGADGIFGAFRF